MLGILILTSGLKFVLGHVAGAFFLYFNHRFVFHGSLGRLPILRNFRMLHSLHHKHSEAPGRNDFLKIPAWGLLLISLLLVALLLIDGWMGLGVISFALLYSYRHYSIHNGGRKTHFSVHHMIHHRFPKYNFSGVYPAIDKLFGTDRFWLLNIGSN